MSRISKLIILPFAAVVALIAFLLIKQSASAPIAFGLQSYTNASAVVTITNLTRSKLDYILKVERKTADSWPKYQVGFPVGTNSNWRTSIRWAIPTGIDSGQKGSLQPGQVSAVTVPVMVYAPPYPWRVSVFYFKNRPAAPNTMRFKVGVWLLKFKMNTLARKIFGDTKVVQVSGPQMEQYEK